MAWSDELGLPGPVRWVSDITDSPAPPPPGGWVAGQTYTINGTSFVSPGVADLPAVSGTNEPVKMAYTPPIENFAPQGGDMDLGDVGKSIWSWFLGTGIKKGVTSLMTWLGLAAPEAAIVAGAAALGAGAIIKAQDGGGNMADTAINGIPILDSPLGFGVPEPPPQMVAKSWKRMAMSNDPQKGNWWIFYWRLIDGRTVMFNPLGSTRWKVWRDYKSIVIGKSLTSRNVTQVARRIHRHAADMRKVLKDIK